MPLLFSTTQSLRAPRVSRLDFYVQTCLQQSNRLLLPFNLPAQRRTDNQSLETYKGTGGAATAIYNISQAAANVSARSQQHPTPSSVT